MRNLTEQVRKQATLAGAESLIALIYDRLDTLFDYLPPDTRCVLWDRPALHRTALDGWRQTARTYAAVRRSGRLCVPPAALQLRWREVARQLERWPTLDCRLLVTATAVPAEDAAAIEPMRFVVSDNAALKQALDTAPDPHRRLQPLADRLQDAAARPGRIVLLCRTRSQAERLALLLEPYRVRLHRRDRFFGRREQVHRGCLYAWASFRPASTGRPKDWP